MCIRRPHLRVMVLGLLLVLGSFVHHAAAQCNPTWLELNGLPGFDSNVNKLYTFDDGGGARLYGVGTFQIAGGETALRVAKFDGTRWSALGDGFNSEVASITSFNGQLYVGGAFTTSGATSVKRVARWNGSAWVSVGAGFDNGSVRSLFVYDNELYAGGSFTLSNSLGVSRIARWNGSAWVGVGTGFDSDVMSLQVYKNQLYAGGLFANSGATPCAGIARFDGTNWQPLLSGLSGGSSVRGVWDMLEFGGELVACGGFTQINGVNGYFAAKWNGSAWTSMSFPTPGGATNGARCLLVYNNTLYCGGTFAATGGIYLAKWTGSAWAGFATFATPTAVNCLGTFGSDLYVAGSFSRINGDAYNRIARYDGNQFSQVGAGFENRILALHEFADALIIGGYFLSAGGFPAYHVVRYDGLNYTPMGNQLTGESPLTVSDFCTHNNELYATGAFTLSGGTKRVAKWTGTAWTALASQPSSGTPNCIASYNGDLVVGSAGINGSTNNVIRYNGSAWVTMGNGLNGEVNDLYVHTGTLYACGNFSASGAVPMSFVARWDGSNWNAVGGSVTVPGTSQRAEKMTSFQNDLIVVGNIPSLGGVTIKNVARWNGSAWSSVGGGFAAGTATAVANYNGGLAVGGSVNVSGFPTPNFVALWNGTDWSGFGSGFTGFVNGANAAPGIAALITYQNELFAGGDFYKAGGRVSSFLAYWGSEPPCVQSVTPTQAVCPGGSAQFTAIATGVPALVYQWRRNNVDLTEGTINGVQYDGTQSRTLSVSNANTNAAGEYTVSIVNAFGATTSNPTQLVYCASDFNCDNAVDDTDFSLFVVAYDALICPEPPATCVTDVNGDGLTDDVAFTLFVVAYDQLVCF